MLILIIYFISRNLKNFTHLSPPPTPLPQSYLQVKGLPTKYTNKQIATLHF